MTIKVRKHVTVSDPVVTACLRDLQHGKLDALAVLADRLAETDAPQAARANQIYRLWRENVRVNARADWSRSRTWTRWEAIASWHVAAICRIAGLFGREWRLPSRTLLYQRNLALTERVAEVSLRRR